MVWCLLEALYDLRFHASVQRGRSDNLLKQGLVHAAGTRESDKQAARPQEFEGQEVDVFVPTRSLLGLGGCGSKFGRVEHNHVEKTPLIAELAQDVKNISFQNCVPLDRQSIECHILAAQPQRFGRRIHRQHRPGPARQRVDRKPARVTETVQHFAAGGKFANPLTVDALVEIEAGFVSASQVNAEFQIVFEDDEWRRANVAAQGSGTEGQALQRTHIGI